MTVEEKAVCDDIFEYINIKLPEWLDSDIFTKTTMEQLGKHYYNHVINTVNNATERLLNAVIKTIAPKDISYSSTEDYYCGLCKILGIERLPSEMLIGVQREYDKIFVQKYNLVLQKYQSERDCINNKLSQVKTDTLTIRNAPPSYSFMRDISADEKRLFDLYSECNSLKTRKEMIDFAIEYLNSKLADFCDTNDTNSVELAKKHEALKLSKDSIFEVDTVFSSYRECIEIVEDDIDRPYALFFKIKIYIIIENANKVYHSSSFSKTIEEAIEDYKQYINLIPKIDDLHLYKNSNPDAYNAALDKLIADYRLVDELITSIDASIFLRERKGILDKTLELYHQGQFEAFNCIVPTQIEGMFADFLRDSTTFQRFSHMSIYADAVLKDKIRYLQEMNSDIYAEAVEYFMYYFNNIIRNRIAHGRYSGNAQTEIQDEIFSKELLLDMMMLVHMLSRKSETDKMYRFIHGYQEYARVIRSDEHPCFGALFNDMIGQKIIADYDNMERYRPIQVAFWLVNPYYEKIYEQVADKSDLLSLREEFLSKEFWEYTLGTLNDVISCGYDYKRINMEFIAVVKGLFRCNVSQDTKQALGKVHAALQTIRHLQ